MVFPSLNDRGVLANGQLRPQFSGHETFPLRYGWLKKAFDAVTTESLSQSNQGSRELFSTDDAIARFGVGKNMVASMRHWAIACNVIKDNGENGFTTTELSELIFDANTGVDPWMENTASTWAFHWHVASTSNKVSYLWFFGYYLDYKFDRYSITQNLNRLCEKRGWKVSEATIKRDVECLVRAYSTKLSKSNAFTEEQVESPFTELGLIQPLNRSDTFELKSGNHSSLSDGVFLYALVHFWKQYTGAARTLSFEAIQYEPSSPGMIFRLDNDALSERLYRISDSSHGIFSWSETGLRQVLAATPIEQISPIDFLKLDYHPANPKEDYHRGIK